MATPTPIEHPSSTPPQYDYLESLNRGAVAWAGVSPNFLPATMDQGG
ncbi:uncharacterized protein VTP21DRAFT_9687 [Calcarisporiella thermophila]